MTWMGFRVIPLTFTVGRGEEGESALDSEPASGLEED